VALPTKNAIRKTAISPITSHSHQKRRKKLFGCWRDCRDSFPEDILASGALGLGGAVCPSIVVLLECSDPRRPMRAFA
jgi:hypothetical protein